MTEMVPARGPMTTALVELLSTAFAAADPAPGLGDGIAPEDAGWPQGQPGKGLFRPYGVLKALTAQVQRAQPALLSQPDAWTFPYQLTSWGSLREEADYVADLATTAIAAFNVQSWRGPDSPVPGFGVQQLVVGSLGPTERTDQVNPPEWSRTDLVTVWLARARRGSGG